MQVAVRIYATRRRRAGSSKTTHRRRRSNAHGALVLLQAQLTNGSRVRMQHRQTHEEQECRVVFLGPVRAGQGELGLEFSESRPTFWRVTFPPEDRPIIAVSHFFDWYQ